MWPLQDDRYILDLMAQVVNADLESMFDRLTDGIMRHFGASHACIHLVQGHHFAQRVQQAALRHCPLLRPAPRTWPLCWQPKGRCLSWPG